MPTSCSASCCVCGGTLHAVRGEGEAARTHLARALELTQEGLPSEFVTPLRGAWAALCLAEGVPE